MLLRDKLLSGVKKYVYGGQYGKDERYKGVCPVCGKTIRICKSIRIEMGANTGSGICPGCKKLLHMTFNEERKEMNLERFKDYQKRHGKECEANAKTDGKGSGI